MSLKSKKIFSRILTKNPIVNKLIPLYILNIFDNLTKQTNKLFYPNYTTTKKLFIYEFCLNNYFRKIFSFITDRSFFLFSPVLCLILESFSTFEKRFKILQRNQILFCLVFSRIYISSLIMIPNSRIR